MNPTFAFAILLIPLLVAGSCSLEDSPVSATGEPGSQADERITFYYGLNESHSRDWAQVTDDGRVGITYFQRFSNSSDDGILHHKTISPDGSENVQTVTTGTRLEISVLLYDESSNPHIFVASSNASDQTIDHHQQDQDGQWTSETIVNFNGEGGRAIYELSADTGPDHSFHLLVLKTRVEVDSEEFQQAWTGSNLYHLTNISGVWAKELVHHYDMAYTYDMYIKSTIRQDIAVDETGVVHVVFGEQIDGDPDPSRLRYANNSTGQWAIETALDFDSGTVDDAGWFPSLALDNDGVPHVACVYVDRVPTYSATYSSLLLLKRLGSGSWQSEVIADSDDGYYGGDGRRYTGGLAHLVFDSHNTARIIFSDIASTHWPGSQRLNVGNIRYGILENGAWNISTLYRQPLPTGFFTATEMHGMCLLVSESTGTIRIVGQELVLTSEHDYTSNLLDFSWQEMFP